MVNKDSERSDIVDKELDIVYGVMNLSVLDISKRRIKELRLQASDFEEIMRMLSERVLEETDMKEDEDDFIETIQTVYYAMYNMIYVVDVYLEGEDFKELEGLTFAEVWNRLRVKDKEFLVASYLR